MMTENDARDAAESFCASYIAAFEASDVAGISRHWAFPSLISSSGRSIVFQDRDVFDKNTARLVDFYLRQGLARVERAVESVTPLSGDTLAMRVHDRVLDASHRLIVEWRTGYLLRREQDTFRAIAAVADGEVEAWAARGTPLGSRS